jgi:pSer/pThr/pTyr-binding forkhead associated (FHA) protein
MIVCQNCLHENQEGTSFCEECGEPLRPGAVKQHLTGRPAVQPPADSSQRRAGTTPPDTSEPGPILPPPALPLPTASGGSSAPLGTLRLRLNNGKAFELKGRSSYVIGRRDDERGIFPELDLSTAGGLEAGVSRAHAVIHTTEAGYTIEDLESTNETLLNFYRLLPRQQYPLKDGDQLRLGALTILVIIS